MPTILLIRHAQASYGAADYDVLSPLAERQIAALDAALVRRGVDVSNSVSGPAVRQRGTAALGRADREVPVDARWSEYDSAGIFARYGPQEIRQSGDQVGQPGMTTQEFQVLLDRALHDWIAAGDAAPVGDAGQTWPQFLAQARGAMDDLAAGLGSGETGLVFTSAGTIAAVCAALLGAPETTFVPLNRVQVNTGISKVAVGRSGLSLVSFNEHGHLDDAGRTLVTYR